MLETLLAMDFSTHNISPDFLSPRPACSTWSAPFTYLDTVFGLMSIANVSWLLRMTMHSRRQ